MKEHDEIVNKYKLVEQTGPEYFIFHYLVSILNYIAGTYFAQIILFFNLQTSLKLQPS